MILTADSDGLFTNQTRIPYSVVVLNTTYNSTVSIKAVVDKNLTKNGNRLQLNQHYRWRWNWNRHFWCVIPQYYGFMTNIKVDVNGWLQPPERYYDYNINLNTTECLNGTHTFLIVPVKIYAMNITGRSYFHLHVRIRRKEMTNLEAVFRQYIRIDNSNWKSHYLKIFWCCHLNT